MVESWPIGLIASTVITVSFLAVAVLLAIQLSRSGTWRTNPLGMGTFFLYLTCGGGHAVHTMQLLDLSLGFATAAGVGARIEYGDFHMWAWDIVIAVAGVWYWTMRRRFPDLVSGTAVYEDLRERRRRALEIHDNVVQGLVRAKLALDLDHRQEGDEAVKETLEVSKRIIGDLLGNEEVRGGDLRRGEASR